MNNSEIVSVFASETYSDSDFPAVEVVVTTAGGAKGRGICSESYSTSSYAPKYLYDGGERFHGFGVTKAAEIINTVLAPALTGMRADEQTNIDAKIKEAMRSGGIPRYVNVSSPVSIAALHAGAASKGIPLYRHVGGQNAFTVPVSGHLCASGSNRYSKNHRAKGRPYYMITAYDYPSYDDAQYALWETAGRYEKMIAKQFRFVTHRGFAMAIPGKILNSDREIWDVLAKSIKDAGHEGRMGIHIDMGANEFYNPETGLYEGLFDGVVRTRDEMIELVEEMARDYPFVIFEDPLEQNDLEGYARLVKTTGAQIVGNDVCGSDLKRIEECIAGKCVNCILLSVNRFETFSDALKAVRMAKNHGAEIMVRNMCGESYDVAAYAVGLNAGSIYESGLDDVGDYVMMTAGDVGPRIKFFGRGGLRGGKFAL